MNGMSEVGFLKSAEKLRSSLNALEEELGAQSADLFSRKGYREFMGVINRQAPVIFAHYDEFVKSQIAQVEGTVQCREGCSFCCAHNITSLEPFEIIYLDGFLKKTDSYGSLMVQLFDRQSEFDNIAESEKQYDEDVVLYKYFQKGFLCPFLTDRGSCGIYLRRPMPCRMFFSLSPPEYCIGSKTIDPLNKNFIVELPDDIEVSLSQIRLIFDPLEIPEFLFSGLLRVNELFGKYA